MFATVRALRLLRTSRWISTGSALRADLATPDESIYTEQHWEMRRALRKIIDKEINPYVDQWEKDHIFPAHKVFKTLGKAGFLGPTRPVEYGGLGLDYSYSIAIGEELGNIKCAGVPMAIGVQTDMAVPALAWFGSHYLKQEFLAPSVAGDKVACLGVSETGAGSDVASIKTVATPKKGSDDLIINGSKMWITNGIQADWMCLLANTREGHPHKNKSLICVPMKSRGITVNKIDKMGNHSSDTAQVFFEDVVVPRTHIIGEEGMGFVYQMKQFQQERMWGTASVLQPLMRLIASTVEYTQQRKAFGKRILDNQVVHFRLAELETEVEALRSLLYRAVGQSLKGHDVTKLASMSKLKAGRLVREVTDSCLQFWGGMGYTADAEVSRMYRDMRLLSIGAGADEVMLTIICKLSGTLPSRS